jgi:hypothetical protein
MSYKRNMIVGLALAGLLATSATFADEIVVTERLEAAATNAVEVDRDLLRKVNAAAAKKAIETVLADTKLDLDIRLIGPTSVKIASDR